MGDIRIFSVLSSAIKKAKQLHETQPRLYVLLWAIAVGGSTITLDRLLNLLLSREVVHRSKIEAGEKLAEENAKLLLHVEHLNTQIALANERHQAALLEQQRLLKEGASIRSDVTNQFDQRLALTRAQLDQEQKLRVVQVEVERNLAQRRIDSLNAESNSKTERLAALQASYPSLEGKGLWERGRPSLKAIKTAEALPERYSAKLSDVLRSTRVERAVQAEVLTIVSDHSDRGERCRPLELESARAEAEHSAAVGARETITQGSTTINRPKDSSRELSIMLSRKQQAEACRREADQILVKLLPLIS